MDDLRYQVDLLKAMNQKLTNENKALSLLSETSDSTVVFYDYECDRISVYGAWNSFFNFQISSISDMASLFEITDEKDAIGLRDVIYVDKHGKDRASMSFHTTDRNRWFECTVNVVYDSMQRPQYKIIRFRDVTKFSVQNEELKYMAYYDSLTGLYNRNYFVSLLAKMVEKAETENREIAVMFIDLDDFRKINDSLGITVGDEVVQIVGLFLRTLGSEDIIISHFNSDIFCIAIYDPVGNKSVEYLYNTIHERMLSPFRLTTGQDILMTVSIGVAEYPEAARNPLELINCAEIVMFKSKSNGKNTIQYFDAPIIQEFIHSVEIENKLRKAVLDNSFMMYYQPQYDLKTSRIRGMEALIRWRDDDGTMIPPSDFIPVAEKNGTIIPIGTWVIEHSIRTFAEWMKKYSCELILSLNISAIQYKQSGFVSEILEAISRYGVRSDQIELEITESVLISDYKEITDKLTILRDYGVRISLDDFGTGYSSLSYLKNLPIDTLKIDKSFIDTVTTDYNSRVIMETIMYMAGKLGLATIAEGVENKEQFDFLNTVGCNDIQGIISESRCRVKRWKRYLIRHQWNTVKERFQCKYAMVNHLRGEGVVYQKF
jgi:diguanylate cyclase (GGDEF)-like protein